MGMRKLNSDEVRISRMSIVRLNSRNKRLDFFIKRSGLDMEKLQLDKDNAEIIMAIKIEELQKSIDELTKELNENEQTIKTVNDQIKEGVNVKEKNPGQAQ